MKNKNFNSSVQNMYMCCRMYDSRAESMAGTFNLFGVRSDMKRC